MKSHGLASHGKTYNYQIQISFIGKRGIHRDGTINEAIQQTHMWKCDPQAPTEICITGDPTLRSEHSGRHKVSSLAIHMAPWTGLQALANSLPH